jgi:hypothetical protein
MVVDKSTIQLARDPNDFATHISSAFGTLNVIGFTEWLAATYEAYVPAEHNGEQGDWWRSRGEFKVGSATQLPTLKVFAFDDESNVVTPTTGYRWLVLSSRDEIKKNNNVAPSLDTAVWQIDTMGVGNRVDRWFAKAK